MKPNEFGSVGPGQGARAISALLPAMVPESNVVSFGDNGIVRRPPALPGCSGRARGKSVCIRRNLTES